MWIQEEQKMADKETESDRAQQGYKRARSGI